MIHILFIFLFLFCVNAEANRIDVVGGGGGSGSVSDLIYGAGWDGDTTVAPSKNAVYDKIETIASGGDNITVNTTAATNANFLDNLYIDWALDTVPAPDDITSKFNYAETLVGNPALLTTECIFMADGLMCEGTTADTIEMKLAFPDPATTDKTLTLPNATDTLVGKDTTDTLTNKTLTAAANVIDADTAVALAADPADCATSTHFAVGVIASGVATCEAIADADVPDTITASSYLPLLGGALTGALTMTVDNTDNYVPLAITQNDVTNNPRGLSITNAGTAASLFIDPNGIAGTSTSIGGAMLLENTGNTGGGLYIYSNAGASTGRLMNIRADNVAFNQAAFHLDYDGTANAFEIVHNSTDTSSNALSITSTNENDTTFGITGQESGKGTLKISHTQPSVSDVNAVAISLLLNGTTTAAQGIFLDTQSGYTTTGKLINMRQNAIEKFVVNSDGSLAIDSGTDAADIGDIRLNNARSIAWEASPAGTDITLSVDASEIMQVSGAFNAGGAVTGSNLSGTNTGDNTVATSGDSATSFFASGTLEVAIGGTGTTTSTGTGAVVLGTSPTFTTSITATNLIVDAHLATTESINLPIYSAKLTGAFVVRTPTSGDASTQGAQIDAGDGNWRLLFDATTDEAAVWQFRLPDYWAAHGEVNIAYTMTSATALEVEFEVDVMCVSDGDAADVGTASFAGVAVGSATVPGTVGYPDEISVTVTDDSCAAGDMMWIYLSTDADDITNDNATGDREVIGVEYEFTR